MATYPIEPVEDYLINELTAVSPHHEDHDVPLLSDSDSDHCEFDYLTMPDSGQNSKDKRKLILATLLCFAFMIAEIIGGYLAGSLAIITDAAHLLSDCISFIVAIIAIYLSKKRPDNRMSFGYKRAEVLGAILSIFGIWILTLGLLFLATNRLLDMNFEIDANAMMTVSALGVFINIIMAYILHGDGLCSHTHSSHSHPYKHHKEPSESSHNNNRTPGAIDLRNKILQNINGDDGLSQSLLLSSRNRSNSICSFRSPSHSRTSSFSRTLPFNGGDSRRASHSNHNSTKLKSLMGSSHRDSIDGDMTRALLEPKHTSKILIESQANLVSVTDASMCQTHGYMQRTDDIDNASECSDEGVYRHHHHHSHTHMRTQNANNNLVTKSINIQAAVIHVIGDFIQSIGVFTSAVIIKFFPQAKVADPICTFVFSIIVIITTVKLMKDSIMVILEAVPPSVNLSTLSEELACVDGVRSVHQLNVWSLTVGFNAMSAHIIIEPFASAEDTLIAATTLAQGFGIKHSTIQIERLHIPDINPDIIQ